MVALKLKDYFDHTLVLPKIPDPDNFGHTAEVTQWGMLGNGPDGNDADVPVGDCAFAGPEHIIMGWLAAANKPAVPFDYASTIAMYSEVTGYDPSQYDPATGENPTDQGGDMTSIAEFWQATGFTAADGSTHKIGAYLALEPGNIDQLTAALYVFEAVGMGFALPSSAEDQFENGEPWSVVADATIEGGHFVPLLGKWNGLWQGITWAQPQLIETDFISTYTQLPIVYLSQEFMDNGESPEHFDMAQLQADLAALNAVA
ncbi:hypothetical protein ACIP5Y_21595 [Nocardia sp. NPDC088792]|uniref:hypothetical protein n=1 Tax=Nocardia sp. NPDC088792 TaxID=3364332 RepID=UPI0037FD8C44